MRRLFWVGVGVAATVGTLRKAREVTDRHVPAGARSALGAAAGMTGALQRARTELRTATAQREAELRADLLGGADLTLARATVDARRAERAARRTDGTDDATGPVTAADPGEAPAAGTADRTGSTGLRPRPGSARATADRAPRPPRPATGSRRAEDPEDGPEGYSFY